MFVIVKKWNLLKSLNMRCIKCILIDPCNGVLLCSCEKEHSSTNRLKGDDLQDRLLSGKSEMQNNVQEEH